MMVVRCKIMLCLTEVYFKIAHGIVWILFIPKYSRILSRITHSILGPLFYILWFSTIQRCPVQCQKSHSSHLIFPLYSSLKEFLPQSYVRVNRIEKKIFTEHKNIQGHSEIEAKVKYVKLARGLPTFGVHFFLVKVSEQCRIFEIRVSPSWCL